MQQASSSTALAGAVAVIDVVPVGMALIGDDDRLLTANHAWRAAFGVPGDADLIGVACAELARREPFRHAVGLWDARAAAEPGVRHRFTLPDGRLREGTWQRLHTGDGALSVLTVADVTGDALVRRRLRQHNRALAELVATKTELVSALLHELRTPLAAARSMAQLLPESLGDPLADEANRAVIRNLDRLGDVVEDIATVSGIENGAVDLDSAPVDLTDLLTDVVARAGADISLSMAPDPDVPAVRGDGERLAEAFDRLIPAVRAVTGGAVHVRVDTAQRQWRVALPLPDRGAADRLFTTTGGRGNATALMFARAVVGRHGGDVGIESRDGVPHLVVRLPGA